MSNPFGSPTAVATEAEETAPETVTEPDADVEAVDPDVDGGTGPDEETVPEAAEKPAKESKPAKSKGPARPPVAEGYITPVAAAKKLGEHLTAKARAVDPNAEEIEVRPQIVYSYLKNNGPDSKNPIPQYTDPALTGGRESVLILEEFLAWWDAKDARVAERKANPKKKAAKETKEADTAPAAEAAGPVVEAE